MPLDLVHDSSYCLASSSAFETCYQDTNDCVHRLWPKQWVMTTREACDHVEVIDDPHLLGEAGERPGPARVAAMMALHPHSSLG